MGRPRKYPTDAERQRAYRQRQEAETIRLDRRAWEQLHTRLEQLQAAIAAAAAAGDPTARRCRAGSEDTLLEKLIRHFQGCTRAGLPGEEGPR